MRIHGAVLAASGAERPYSASRPLRIEELELDGPAATEVLVRVEVAGLCHSDLSVIDGNRPRPLPMLLGHEAAGIVEQVGDAVTDLAVGQRVVMTFLPRCGQCAACATDGRAPCIPGSAANGVGELLAGGRRLTRDGVPLNHHLGVSAFATHTVVDRRSVVPVGDDVPARVAALLGCAVLTGGGAVVNVGRPQPGQRVAVVGLGGVGMAAVLTALAHDGVEVFAVDPVADKRDLALRLGAHLALTPDEVAASGITADVAIDAAGVVPAFESAVAMTAIGGRTVTIGLPHPDARASISPLALTAGGREIVGSYLGSCVPARDVPRFEAMWRSGALPVESLVSGTVSLEDINDGMEALAAGAAVRQIVEF